MIPDFTERLGITHPIVLAPMLGVVSPEMVATISNHGGLGSLPVGGLSAEKTKMLIRETKKLTNCPFAVNLFVHHLPLVDKPTADNMQEYLYQLSQDNHISFEKQDVARIRFHSYTEQIDILLEENIPVVSFTFGIIDDKYIQQFKDNQVLLMGTATCAEEAVLLDKKGIDVIVAQGIEAGGHRGTFLEDCELPQVGLSSLISQIVSITPKPVIAAGGIASAKSIHAALGLGAQGVQSGSVFIACDESLAVPSYKASVCQSSGSNTVLTRCFSGRWARSIKNRFVEEIEKSGLPIPDYPIQNSLTSSLRGAAQKQDNKDFISLYVGQSASQAVAKPVATVFADLAAYYS